MEKHIAEFKSLVNKRDDIFLYEIAIEDILNYKYCYPKYADNLGGIYLIENTNNNKKYIGKSIDYMYRLKTHLFPSSNKSNIDIELNLNKYEFTFHLIFNYKELGINFFNRTKSTIVEQLIISKLKTYIPYGYNSAHYGYL